MRHVKKMTHKRLTTIREDHIAATNKYLRDSGWEYECAHPGSQWLWVKAIDYYTYGEKTYRCSEDTAVQIQSSVDEWEAM